MTRVFPRTFGRELPTAVRAEGCWIWDANGRRYLDASGGAIVVGIAPGDLVAPTAMAGQAATLSYVHGTQFTTEAVESYAAELAPLLPMDDARVYLVSGGSEAVETAFKLARAYHLARGEDTRHKIVARWGSYHGNTRGALDASGREPLRLPYLPWLGQTVHVPPVYEYRCPLPTHPDRCGERHAEILDETIRVEGPETVAAFIAEPMAGATLGAAVPPDDYWPAVQDVCRAHGVLVIADEVMTGFGRTGEWFGSDHWAVRPDILAAGKGCASGYWPLGLAACTSQVYQAVASSGFVHGFTYSHHVVGAAVGRAVLRRLREGSLVEASRDKGERLLKQLSEALGGHPHVGDIRGLGLMAGVELVLDRETKAPFPRAQGVAEQVLSAAKADGLLLYSSTGCADSTNGDLIMLGPPFVISDSELTETVEKLAGALSVLQR